MQIIQPDDPRAPEQGMMLNGGNGQDARATGPGVGRIFQTLLILILTAAAIYGVVFFVKRASKPQAAKNPYLKVLASVHLGSNRYVHVVSVGSKAWLLGASDGGVRLVDEIDDKEILDAMLLDDSQKTEAGAIVDFKALLGRMGAAFKPGASTADNIRSRRERLKGL